MKLMWFHLTVNKAGVVSLWDSEEVARKAAPDEGYLHLQLTFWQADLIEKAQQEAKE